MSGDAPPVRPLFGEGDEEPGEKLRLGGMALRNGLLVHGPTHWAAAVRTRDGEIRTASGKKPDLGGCASQLVSGVRCVTRYAEAVALIPLVKCVRTVGLHMK